MSEFTISEVKALTLDELTKWELTGWTFKTDNRTTRHGWCDTMRKVVGVSTESIKHCDDDSLLDTILHEVSHALHYKWCCDNGINYNERVYQRGKYGKGRWVRKIPPHGRQWKQFAAMVGANPQATTSTKDTSTAISNWRVVIVRNTTVEDTHSNCQRFLKNMKRRYVTGRKDVIGCLYLVNGKDWSQTVSGQRCVNTLKFYQKPNIETKFDYLTLST